MTSWLAEYMSALDARDRREKAQTSFINTYTKLADRTASLEATAAQPPSVPEAPPTSSTPTKAFRPSTPAKGKTKDEDPSSTPADTLTRLRADLSTTQRSRASLQSELSTLTTTATTLRAQAAKDGAQLAALSREKAALERKVRDRDEEIKGKARLVEQVQDEMVALSLQLNVAEQRAEKVKRENEELVERWMRRVGREVEEMNERSRWS